MRETEKQNNSNKEHEKRKNNKSSTKQVELSCLKEEIKYIKRTLDIPPKRQWLETSKDNEEDSRDIQKKNQKIKKNKLKTQKPTKRIKNALKDFKIYYQNVRGLKSKLDSLQEMIDD